MTGMLRKKVYFVTAVTFASYIEVFICKACIKAANTRILASC
jgi:hypothetical protein